MKQAIIAIPAMLLMSLAIFSCKKNDDHHTSQPAFAITNPAEGQVFHKNDSVKINAVIQSEDEMHGYRMSITTANGDTVFTKSDHAHSAKIDISEVWVDTLSGTNALKLNITATIDHDGTTAAKCISFTSEP